MFFVGLVLLLGIAAFFVAAFGRRFEEAAPLALCVTFLSIYACLLLGILRLGIFLVALLALCGAAFFVLRLVKTRERSLLLRLFTPGLACYLILSAGLYLITKGLVAAYWDEISHWMPALKELWLVDTQGFPYRSLSECAYYPPFASVIQYFFLRCAGRYVEGYAYAANAVVYVTLLLPLFRSIDWKRFYRAPFVAALVMLVPMTIFTQAFGTIYVDCLIGTILAYVFAAWFGDAKKSTFTALSTAAGICMLTMVKNSGVEIALIPLAIIALDLLIEKNGSETLVCAKTRKTRGLLLGGYALLAFGAHALWHISLRFGGVSSDLVGEGVRDSAPGGFPQAYQLTGIAKSFSMLLEPRQTGSFSLSILVVAALLSLVGLYLITRARNTDAYKRVCVCVGGVSAGFFAYYVLILTAMLLLFLPRQVIIMQSFDRYLSSWLLAMLGTFVFLLIDGARGRKAGLVCIAAVLLALLPFVPLNQSMDFNSKAETEWRQAQRAPYVETMETVEGLDAKKDVICYVDQAESSAGYYMLRYLAAPVRVIACGAYILGEKTNEFDTMRTPLTAEEWSLAVLSSDANYVYVHRTDVYFNDTMGALFADPIRDGAFYRISEQDGLLRLTRDAG